MSYRPTKNSYLEFCHEHLHSLEEDGTARMCHWLLVEALLDCLEKSVELLRLDDWPWDDVEIVAMQTRDEVLSLLSLNDLLEFEEEPARTTLSIENSAQV